MLDRFRFVPVRLLQAIPVLFGVTIVVFFMVHLLPGNPARGDPRADRHPERVAALNNQLGLDKPLWDQYLLFLEAPRSRATWARASPTSSRSRSWSSGRPDHAVPAALRAGALAGHQRAAGRAGRDRPGPGAATTAVRVFTLLGQGMPQFWVGIMLILLLAVKAGPVPGRRLRRDAAASTGTTCSCRRSRWRSRCARRHPQPAGLDDQRAGLGLRRHRPVQGRRRGRAVPAGTCCATRPSPPSRSSASTSAT